MKKKPLIITGLTAALTASFAFGVYAASDIKLFINGKAINTPIEIVDGNSYVPLRVVSESLGADVKWDGDARTISIASMGEAAPTKTDVKSFNVDVNVQSGPMIMKISKVTLDPAYKKDKYYNEVNAIILDVEIENTSTDSVFWTPHSTGGKLVLNTKEQIEHGSFNSDDVGGEFVGKVIKKGKIVFESKGELSAITSMNYVIDAPFNSKTYSKVGEDKTVDIVLK